MSNAKVIRKEACPVCPKSRWWNLGRESYLTKIHAGLVQVGFKPSQAKELTTTASRLAEVKDDKPWFCSVPCVHCNKDGSHPAPAQFYYRLIWTDKTKTIYVARTGDWAETGYDLTREQFENLNDCDYEGDGNDEEEEEEDEEETEEAEKPTKKTKNALVIKDAPDWVNKLFAY